MSCGTPTLRLTEPTGQPAYGGEHGSLWRLGPEDIDLVAKNRIPRTVLDALMALAYATTERRREPSADRTADVAITDSPRKKTPDDAPLFRFSSFGTSLAVGKSEFKAKMELIMPTSVVMSPRRLRDIHCHTDLTSCGSSRRRPTCRKLLEGEHALEKSGCHRCDWSRGHRRHRGMAFASGPGASRLKRAVPTRHSCNGRYGGYKKRSRIRGGTRDRSGIQYGLGQDASGRPDHQGVLQRGPGSQSWRSAVPDRSAALPGRPPAGAGDQRKG